MSLVRVHDVSMKFGTLGILLCCLILIALQDSILEEVDWRGPVVILWQAFGACVCTCLCAEIQCSRY